MAYQILPSGILGLGLLLASAACSTTTVDVAGSGGANGGDAGEGDAATPASICARTTQLPCATPATCKDDITGGLGTCKGSDAQKQALLDCLASAQWDCSGGIPTTHDCANAFATAQCSSWGSVDGGLSVPPDASSPVDAGASGGDSGVTQPSVCPCQGGTPHYSCTSDATLGQFSMQLSEYQNSSGFSCVSTGVTECADFGGVEPLSAFVFSCDSSGFAHNDSSCNPKGTWSQQGNIFKFNVQFSDGFHSGTCTQL